MIFNVSTGGISTISVTAPVGAVIVASCLGLDLTGTGTCVLEAPIIGTWQLVCTFEGIEKRQEVTFTTFGDSESVTFTYEAVIAVVTFPGATVVATKGGQEDLTGTASEAGTLSLVVPAGGRGDWEVTSTYDSWESSDNVSVENYDVTYPLVLPLTVPDFSYVLSDNTTYTFTKDSDSAYVDGVYNYYRNGNDWEFYMLVGGEGELILTGSTALDVFLCGAGNNGGWSPNWWGDGGAGGARKTISAQTLSGTLAITCGASNGAHSLLGELTSEGGIVSGQSVNGGYSFDDSTMQGPDRESHLVGAGGGKGAYSQTDGRSGSSYGEASGGDKGGGDGGSAHIDGSTRYANDGAPGTFYGAGGGGGGTCTHDTHPERNLSGSGGAGYRGFVAIRSKR